MLLGKFEGKIEYQEHTFFLKLIYSFFHNSILPMTCFGIRAGWSLCRIDLERPSTFRISQPRLFLSYIEAIIEPLPGANPCKLDFNRTHFIIQ